MSNVYREIDEGGACGILFLDLAKAFDTITHDLLVDKFSSVRQVNCGVPQGLTMGRCYSSAILTMSLGCVQTQNNLFMRMTR